MEIMEDRNVPSGTPTIAWDGGAGNRDWLNPLNWTDDRLPGAGDIVLIQTSGQSINVTGPVTIGGIHSNVSLVVSNSLSVTSDSEILGALAVSTGGSFNILGGTTDLTGGASFSGAINVGSGATVQFSNGSFWSGGGGDIDGTIVLSSNLAFSLGSGSLRLDEGSAIIGGGRLSVSGGSLNVAGNASVQNASLHSYTSVIGTGTLTVTGIFDWYAGYMQGTGTTAIASGATLNLHSGVYGGRRLEGRTITNAGLIRWLGDSVGAESTAGAVIHNLSNGVVEVLGGASAYFIPNANPVSLTFLNEGLLRVVSGGLGFSNAAFNNSGTVEVQSGSLGLATGNSTGTFTLAAGTTLGFNGSYTLAVGSSVTGDGSVNVSGGSVNVNGVYSVGGSTSVSGSIRFNSSATTHNGSLTSYATLGGTGTLTITGTFDWYAGGMRESGVTAVASGAMLRLHTGVYGGRFLEDRTLTNAGTVMWLGGEVGAQFGNGGTFRNLAGGLVQTFGGYLFTGPNPNYPTLLTFVNEGVFRVVSGGFGTERAVFNNPGTVEVQSGSVIHLVQGSATGMFTVDTGGTLGFQNYVLQQGSSISGNGKAGVAYGYLNVAGNVPVTNFELSNQGTLGGSGTLTVNGTLSWTGGSMSGDGKTLLPTPTATLALIGNGARYLFGRKLINLGRTTWDTTGAITRIVDGGFYHVYDNTGVTPTTPSATQFNAITAAGQLYRAMYGGLTGWGTDEEAIYKVLDGKSSAQIQAIRNAYSAMYPTRNLDADLVSEMGGSEWQRANHLMQSNSAAADALTLYYAMHGGLGIGSDEDTIFRVLDGRDLAYINSIKAHYVAYTEGRTLEQDLVGDLEGSELRRALALVAGNQTKADAEALYYAMNGGLSFGTDEETIFRILSTRTPAQLELIRSEYFQQYQRSLNDDLLSDLDDTEMDQANAYMAGDPNAAAAARLRRAMEGLGTNEREVWTILDGLTSEKRAAIADAYKRMYEEELRTAIYADFEDNLLYGDELSKTLALLDHGGLSPAAKIYYAIKGASADVPTIKAALTNRTLSEIVTIRTEFNNLYASRYGMTFDNALMYELSGRDEFEVMQLLQGRPTDVLGRLQRLEANHQNERTGIWNGISSAMLDEFSSDGILLDYQVTTARQAYNAAVADGVVTPEEEDEILRLLDYVEEGIVTYQGVKDSASNTFGTVLSNAAGIAVIWATGGTATPLVLAVLRAGGAGAIGQVVGQVTISGQTYDVDALPGHLLEGFANGGTVPITFGGLPNATTSFGRLLQGAKAGALEGIAGGFAGGITGALIQNGIWSEGLWQGLVQVGEQGLLGALTGGLTGGALGGFLGQLWHECFPAGTLVHTEDGPKAIETIESGDEVWAYNFRLGGWELRPVIQPLQYDYNGDMVTLTAGEETIETTGHHPFWVIEGEDLHGRPKPQHVEKEEPGNTTTPGRWVDARDLKVHDRVLLRSGRTAEVTAINTRIDALRVYNLHIADLNNYAVGETGVLVHNRIAQMPSDYSSRGTWNDPVTGNWTRSADTNNGTFTTYNEDIRRAAANPGDPLPAYVSVVYTNRYPDFDPFVRNIDGVRAEVTITYSVDPNIRPGERLDDDFASADAAYAELLNQQGVRIDDGTANGRAWEPDDVEDFRGKYRLTWHHVEDVNLTTHEGTMQLIPTDINNWFSHTGGRSILSNDLGLPTR